MPFAPHRRFLSDPLVSAVDAADDAVAIVLKLTTDEELGNGRWLDVAVEW